ncbi:LAME_0H13806g1_1 [Lachancea meyersii CBS 8951]|uniref:LAME_0H13806g1_1 n=1 Tax=Lachancea meyersii CBS 8951 TaxID=1266667 RepID=A0A1G4KH25_9SACH|nr:LAME_0H13806g1_1 [Lachancea meyersii CBS 8951]
MSKSESSSQEVAGGASTSRSATVPVLEQLKTGSQVIVGNHRVEIVGYLAEGGFAQIYIVKFVEYANELEKQPAIALAMGEVACLKRVLVTDENGLNEMRNEVSVMKQLSGSANVVQYYDSHASRSRDGSVGFEVMLLMELCPNNSLLDYMNQRLATKLSEGEIVKIMFDVSRALAQMHYLPVPLIHRDIKIENVLVDADNNFKLCDFGSTSTCLPVANTHQEIALLTNNIYIHTTPQYRSPEMIDLYRWLPVDEKSDIWALGIFLYKLLFYTTPFELTGQFAILHSKYEFPVNNYSSKLINLIIIMLAENPNLRPNIYQVMDILCSILKIQNPIEDKYQQGPYSFDKYAQYQAKLQRIQYQMYLSYENKERVDSLNDLFINCFEIAPKQAVNMGRKSSALSETSEASKSGPVGALATPNRSQPIGEEDIGLVQQQFPSVEDLDTYLHDGGKRESGRHNFNTTTSLGTGSHSSSKIDLVKPSDDIKQQGQSVLPPVAPAKIPRDATAKSSASTKQHKSMNPFPYIQPENYGVDRDTNPVFDNDSSKKEVDSRYLESKIHQAIPGVPAQSQPQTSGSHSEQQGGIPAFQHSRPDVEMMRSYHPYYGGTPTPMADNTVEKPVTSHYPYQTLGEKPEAQHQPLLQPQRPAPALNSQQPQVVLQHPQVNQQKPSHAHENEQLLVDFSEANKKEFQKLDLTYDSVDLSTPTKGGTKDSANLSEQSLASTESIPVELRRKAPVQNTTLSEKSTKSSNPSQPASGRRSLDLKFQELNFSASPSVDTKLRKTKTVSNQSRRSNNGGSTSDSKKSFAHGRKSLDLDHFKRETTLSTENNASKRKSFFGKFKG